MLVSTNFYKSLISVQVKASTDLVRIDNETLPTEEVFTEVT